MEQIYRKGPGMPGKAGRKTLLAAAHNKFVKKKAGLCQKKKELDGKQFNHAIYIRSTVERSLYASYVFISEIKKCR